MLPSPRAARLSSPNRSRSRSARWIACSMIGTAQDVTEQVEARAARELLANVLEVVERPEAGAVVVEREGAEPARQQLQQAHGQGHRAVARGLQIKTVAESVGDDQTIQMLQEHGVDYAQGYHVGRPGPLSEMSSGTVS
ncbi:MAG TPA: EAL domain-containing protein [Baekduia sp.]|nr:EAL domain-containing protein [Baekduia sp.]